MESLEFTSWLRVFKTPDPITTNYEPFFKPRAYRFQSNTNGIYTTTLSKPRSGRSSALQTHRPLSELQASFLPSSHRNSNFLDFVFLFPLQSSRCVMSTLHFTQTVSKYVTHARIPGLRIFTGGGTEHPSLNRPTFLTVITLEKTGHIYYNVCSYAALSSKIIPLKILISCVCARACPHFSHKHPWFHLHSPNDVAFLVPLFKTIITAWLVPREPTFTHL